MEVLAGLALLLENADKAATLAINSLNCPASDFLWQVFSNRLAWVPFYIGCAVIFFKRLGWRKALVLLAACALTILACDQLGNLFKHGFERLRPCWDPYMSAQPSFHLLEGKGSQFGFFSAHAANALGFAVCAGSFFKWQKVEGYRLLSRILIVWAALVGLSRIFVGKHFLGDVVVGFAFGILIGSLFAFLAQKLASKL